MTDRPEVSDPPAGLPGPTGICGEVFDYWRGLNDADGTSVPTRERIDLLTLPKSARENFFLIERRDARYLVRLASTRLIDNMGGETTGKYLDELMRPEIYPARRALFDRCLEAVAPVYYGATLAAPTRDHVAFRRILLPVRSAEDGPADLVCGVMDFVAMTDLRNAPERGAALSAEQSRNNGLVFKHIFSDGRWSDLADTMG